MTEQHRPEAHEALRLSYMVTQLDGLIADMKVLRDRHHVSDRTNRWYAQRIQELDELLIAVSLEFLWLIRTDAEPADYDRRVERAREYNTEHVHELQEWLDGIQS